MNETAEVAANKHKDYTGAKIGMWLFLFTELFLFFGPFLLYSIFRYRYSADFINAGSELSLFVGSINTVVLLTSSLSVALSISALQKGNKKLTLILLGVTIVLGAFFLVNKYFEWDEKIIHGLYPGAEALLSRPKGEILFFGLYFFMTGLHALHVVAGVSVLAVIAFFVMTDKVTRSDYIKIENGGLYWHLVDVIWIYLFPLFYLIR